MYDVPTLTDGVVTLRAHHEGDIDRVVEQCRDPLSIRWTVVPAPYTRDDAARFVRHAMPGGWATNEEWAFAVEYEGRFGGTVSLRNRVPGRAEIAFGAHPDLRGTGAMERGLRLMLDWGFSAAGADLETVIWYANEGNWASRRLAWKVGFSFDGTLRGWLDHRGTATDSWAGTLRRGEAMEPRETWLVAPVIELDDLRLRPQREDDLATITAAFTDPELLRWSRLEEPPGEGLVRHNMLTAQMESAVGRTVRWAIADGRTDDLLGVVNLFDIDDKSPGSAEVGYWMSSAARGRGQATLATRAAVRHGFIEQSDGGLGLDRVRALVGVGNEPSRAVLHKVGFTETGRLRKFFRIEGVPMDVALLDLLAEEFTD